LCKTIETIKDVVFLLKDDIILCNYLNQETTSNNIEPDINDFLDFINLKIDIVTMKNKWKVAHPNTGILIKINDYMKGLKFN
jgi:hypothetical protein